MRQYIFWILVLIAPLCWSQDNEEYRDLRGEIERLRQRVETLEKALDKKETGEKRRKVDQLEQRVDTLEETLSNLYQYTESDFVDNSGHLIEAYWNGRPWFRTRDNSFAISFGGFVQLDIGFAREDAAIQDQLDDITDFVEFRAVRPDISGTFYDRYFFQFQFDFAVNDTVAFKNFFVGMTGLPFDGHVKIGFFKEFFSLEQLGGRTNITFLERSSIDAFTPQFQLGIGYTGYAPNKRMTFSIGLFREVEDDDPPRIEDDSGSYAMTTRITALPYVDQSGTTLIHVGAAYSYRSPLNDEVQFRSRPEIAVGPQFVDTGVIEDVEEVHLIGLEYALVYALFSLQAEAILAVVDDEAFGTQEFYGFYVYTSFFLTGEHRPYKKKAGVFGRPDPYIDFMGEEQGIGAIELAIRYSKIDLNEEIRGRRMDDITVGINWYLNHHMRLQLNYIYSLLKNLDDSDKTDANILTLRFQVAF